MTNRLTSLTSPTALRLLAQLVRKQLLPVPVPEVSSPLSGDGSEASPLTIPSPLPVANGGTGGTAAPTAGGIAYGSGTAHAFSAAGVAGQLLRSNGAGAPSWLTPTPTLEARVLPADVTTDEEDGRLVTPAWRWDLVRYDVLSIHAQLAVLGTSTSAPRVGIFCNIAGEWSASNGLIRALTFAGGKTVPAFDHIPVGTWTPSVTSGVPTLVTVWNLDAVLVAPDDGRFGLHLATSAEGDDATVLAGSFVEFSHLVAT